MAGFDLNLLEISLILQTLLMLLALWKKIPFSAILGGLLGMFTIVEVLVHGNTITYYSGSVLVGATATPSEVDVILSGFALTVLIIPVIMSFYIAIRELYE